MYEYMLIYQGKADKCLNEAEANTVLKQWAKEAGVDVEEFAEGYCDIYENTGDGLKLCNEKFYESGAKEEAQMDRFYVRGNIIGVKGFKSYEAMNLWAGANMNLSPWEVRGKAGERDELHIPLRDKYDLLDILKRISFMLNVAHQNHDLDAIGSAADYLLALANGSFDNETIENLYCAYGEDWTIEEVNKNYGFNNF